MQQHFDYIIAGAGAAGLSLAWKLLQMPTLSEKHILIVDDNLQPQNNKTWCFWDSGTPPFSGIIHKKWTKAEVSIFDELFTQPLNVYPYYCLRQIDFEEKILSALSSHPNITLLQQEVSQLTSTSDSATLHTEDQSFEAEYIFQSCFESPDVKSNQPRYPLLQHFLGWEIKTEKAVFDDSSFTLMDFDKTVSDKVAFMYLLPWKTNSGLIEYTVFSDQVLDSQKYEEKISLYLNSRFNLQPIDYTIQRREFGKIPMQDRPAELWYRPRILNVGIVGGLTKPSTGYTFKRIQDYTDDIIESLISDNLEGLQPNSSKRFKAYDLWLLQIIHDHPEVALKVFDKLFENNSMDEIFRFLGEQTSFWQEFQIMSSVPYFPFLRAIWETSGRLREI